MSTISRLLLIVAGCILAGVKVLATAPPEEKNDVITNSIGMKFIKIPAGKFSMGSPAFETGRGNHEDQHDVEITRSFYLGIYEVTIWEFHKFVSSEGFRTDAEVAGKGFGYDVFTGHREDGPKYRWDSPGWKTTSEHPVTNVSWSDAKKFCEWLSKKEGKKYRLPTEAEWEYACRAGSNNRFHHGGDAGKLAEFANVADTTLKNHVQLQIQLSIWRDPHLPTRDVIPASDGWIYTSPVGKYKKNDFGVYDMHGNVSEWCEDWYGPYVNTDKADPMGPASGSGRVARGGSWQSSPANCRSASRSQGHPNYRSESLGFRVVLLP